CENLSNVARLAKQRGRVTISDHIVGRVFVNDNLRMSALNKGLLQLVNSFIQFHGNDLCPRYHAFPYQYGLEFFSIVNDAVFYVRIARRGEHGGMTKPCHSRHGCEIGQTKHPRSDKLREEGYYVCQGVQDDIAHHEGY